MTIYKVFILTSVNTNTEGIRNDNVISQTRTFGVAGVATTFRITTVLISHQ